MTTDFMVVIYLGKSLALTYRINHEIFTGYCCILFCYAFMFCLQLHNQKHCHLRALLIGILQGYHDSPSAITVSLADMDQIGRHLSITKHDVIRIFMGKI